MCIQNICWLVVYQTDIYGMKVFFCNVRSFNIQITANWWNVCQYNLDGMAQQTIQTHMQTLQIDRERVRFESAVAHTKKMNPKIGFYSLRAIHKIKNKNNNEKKLAKQTAKAKRVFFAFHWFSSQRRIIFDLNSD